jgi:hypothetical protein
MLNSLRSRIRKPAWASAAVVVVAVVMIGGQLLRVRAERDP